MKGLFNAEHATQNLFKSSNWIDIPSFTQVCITLRRKLPLKKIHIESLELDKIKKYLKFLGKY